MCVSPFAVNWACRKASWGMTAANNPDQCTFPDQLFSAMDTDLFGECYFAGLPASSSVSLADELTAAARATFSGAPSNTSVFKASFSLARPAKIAGDEAKFWGYMANGTQVAYPNISATGERGGMQLRARAWLFVSAFALVRMVCVARARRRPPPPTHTHTHAHAACRPQPCRLCGTTSSAWRCAGGGACVPAACCATRGECPGLGPGPAPQLGHWRPLQAPGPCGHS